MTGRRPAMPQMANGLRRWTRTHDAHVRAAVELLIGHDVWLRRTEFRAACVHADGDVWIDWRAAREAFDSGEFDRCSSTERAVLDLAIALGIDRNPLNAMGPANSRLVAHAVATAVAPQRGRTGRAW